MNVSTSSSEYLETSKLQQEIFIMIDPRIFTELDIEERKYLLSFKKYIVNRQEEILKNKNTNKDVNEIVFLIKQFKETQKSLLNLKFRVEESKEHYELLKKIIRDKIKESALLRCFLKQLEVKLLKKDNWGDLLRTLQSINNATTTDSLMKSLQNKVSLNIVDNMLKKPRSIVILSSATIDYTKEREYNSRILHLNNKIAKQTKELADLKEKLNKIINSNKSLTKLFESCVNEFTATKKEQYSLDTNCSDSSLISQMLMKPSAITHFSDEAKSKLFEFFLRHDKVIKKLAEIVMNQFNCVEKEGHIKSSIPHIQRNDKRTSTSIIYKSNGTSYSVKLNKSKILFQGRALPDIAEKQQINIPIAYLTLQNK